MPGPLRTLALLAALALAAGCGGNDALLEVSPGKHDFGRVMQGQLPEYTFTLTNRSDHTVGFKAMPNCSCFAVAHGLKPLDPGESQDFQVLFDTTQLMGPVKGKWVTLHTDHPDVPGMVIPLEGEIYRAYSATPETFHLGRIDGRPANYEPRVIRVRPESDYVVRLERAVSTPNVFTFEPVPHDSGGFDVKVSIPRDLRRPVGIFQARIRLELALTAPGGKGMRQNHTVDVDGFWSLE